MIEFACPNCGRILRVADEFMGQSGNCQFCRGRIIAPSYNEDDSQPINAPPPLPAAQLPDRMRPQGKIGSKNASGYRDNRIWARITVGLLILCGLIHIAAFLIGVSFVRDFYGTKESAAALTRATVSIYEMVGDADRILSMKAKGDQFDNLTLTGWICFCATGIPFLVWFHRAYANLTALGATGLKYEHWAIAGFFVPIISLVRPYQVAEEIWKESHAAQQLQTKRGNGVLNLWWLSFLAMGVLSLLSSEISPTADATIWLIVVFHSVAAVCAVVACVLILRIQEAQEIAIHNPLIRPVTTSVKQTLTSTPRVQPTLSRLESFVQGLRHKENRAAALRVLARIIAVSGCIALLLLFVYPPMQWTYNGQLWIPRGHNWIWNIGRAAGAGIYRVDVYTLGVEVIGVCFLIAMMVYTLRIIKPSHPPE